MATAWEPLRYGWGWVYWLTVEGVPVLFAQRDIGLARPSGLSSTDASLVMTKSGEIGVSIDRNAGLGRGTPLRFALRDSTTVRSYLQRPSNFATLGADLTSSVTTVTVADTTGWPSSGALYAGAERITYTGTTAATFTGCTRGVAGKAYPHRKNDVSSLLTDRPRWWKGREVKLWVSPVTPTGFAPGTNWDDDAELIWRGFINQGPSRDSGLWTFEALPLDRVIARPLAAEWTGTLNPSEVRTESPNPAFQTFSVSIKGVTSAGVAVFDYTGGSAITFNPFSGIATGTLLAGSKIRALIKDAFDIAVSTLAEINEWHWQSTEKKAPGAFFVPLSEGYAGDITAYIELAAAATVDYVYLTITGPIIGATKPYAFPTLGGVPAGYALPTGWISSEFMADAGPWPQKKSSAPSLYYPIELDEGDPDLAPTSGKVKIGNTVYDYSNSTAEDGRLWLAGITQEGSGVDVGALNSKNCTIIAKDTGSASEIVLKTMLSSGENALRDATYDALLAGQGYGLEADAVDKVGIPKAVDVAWLSTVQLTVAHGSRSLEAIVGGLLALSGRAIATKQTRGATNRKVRLSVVSTSPVGSNHVVTITDADLLSRLAEPVQAGQPPGGLNQITVEGQEVDGGAKVVINISDRGSVMASGARAQTFNVPIGDRDLLVPVASSWARARFARDHTSQVIRLRVGPWLDVEVGDIARLELTHHALWQWSSGTPGYTGQGRVLGKTLDPNTGAVQLEMLVDGQQATAGLCPSAVVLASTASTVDIHTDYEPIFSRALEEAVGPIKLITYRPGQTEAITPTFDIDSATVTGGVLRLNISSGTPTFTTNSSHITWPSSADDDAYQALYMHDADGTRWA